MYHLYYSLFSYSFAGMIEKIEIKRNYLLGLGGTGNDLLAHFKKILKPLQRTVNINSVAKVLNIRAEDIMIILVNNGVNISPGYLPKLTESHLEILWKVYSRKMNSYVSKSFNNVYKKEKSDDLLLFYTYFKKDNNSIKWGTSDYCEETYSSFWTSTFESKKCDYSSLYSNSHYQYLQEEALSKWLDIDSEKLKEAFFDLIYHEDDQITSFEKEKNFGTYIDEDFVSLIFHEIKNETNQGREILSKIIRKLSFKAKIKVKNICNTILSIIILIILSCRYYIFTDDDEHPRAEKKVCASFG